VPELSTEETGADDEAVCVVGALRSDEVVFPSDWASRSEADDGALQLFETVIAELMM
jgi:hypothetical protein